MKSTIHPSWNHQATVTCSCGNTFLTGATTDTLLVDICSACHPFYTGSMKFVDTQGRVEKFMKNRAAADANKGKATAKKKSEEKKEHKSLKDLLTEEKKRLQSEEKAA